MGRANAFLLVEQILASHSQLDATQELPDIPRIVRGMEGLRPDPYDPRYPDALARLLPGSRPTNSAISGGNTSLVGVLSAGTNPCLLTRCRTISATSGSFT
jgi:hypothetical protein